MNMRTILFLVAALIMAGGSALFLERSWVNQRQKLLSAQAPAPEAKEVERSDILLAAHDLVTGHILTASDLRWKPFPKEDILDIYLTPDAYSLADLEGAVVRQAFVAGEPITRHTLVHPGDRGFLAAVLAPDRRALSIEISAVSGISGLVFPGDRVDVLFSKRFSTNLYERQEYLGAEILLEDVRVLALDQRTNNLEQTPALATTATLEVTPKQAQILAVARLSGSLSLSLRSLSRSLSQEASLGKAPGESGEASGESLADKSQSLPSSLSQAQAGAAPEAIWDWQASLLVGEVQRENNLLTNQPEITIYRGGVATSSSPAPQPFFPTDIQQAEVPR